ncbi:hypothetical protein BC826DRAFT_46876 [Russula brevipes]|nr:hypothetical protein BC826DRAFT_46876 [Russula brevipes]
MLCLWVLSLAMSVFGLGGYRCRCARQECPRLVSPPYLPVPITLRPSDLTHPLFPFPYTSYIWLPSLNRLCLNHYFSLPWRSSKKKQK